MIERFTAILILTMCLLAPAATSAEGLSAGEVEKLVQVPAGRLLVHTLTEAEAALIPLQSLTLDEALTAHRDEYLEHLGALRASIRSLGLVCMLAFPAGPTSPDCPPMIRQLVDASRPLAADSDLHDRESVTEVLAQVNDLSVVLDEMVQSLRQPSTAPRSAPGLTLELHGAD